jgi:hypothetical protein
MRLDTIQPPLMPTVPHPALPTTGSDQPTSDTALIATTTPSTTVSLSKPASLPDTYAAALDIVQVRKPIDQTEAQATFTKSLATELSKARTGKTAISASQFFRQLGDLSRTTNDYQNEARSFKVAANKAPDIGKLDFNADKGSIVARTNLNLRTRDGDSIDVRLEHRRGQNGESVEVSFSVTGKLSKAEQDALAKLAQKLGDVADEFFRTGSSELRGLEEFDQDLFVGFHLDMSKPKGEKLVTSSYDYSIDDRGRHLHATDADGYRIDIDVALQQSLPGKANSEALQAYLDVIRDSLNRFQSPSANARFVRDGFASLFGDAVAVSTNRIMDAFNTGLPDFNAAIRAPVIRDQHLEAFPEFLELKLSQQTRHEQIENHRLIKQTNRYELNSQRLKGLPGKDDGDLRHGDFVFEKIQEQHENTRLLDMTRDTASVLSEVRHGKNNARKTYHQFSVEDQQNDNNSSFNIDRLVQQSDKDKSGLVYKLLQQHKHMFTAMA